MGTSKRNSKVRLLMPCEQSATRDGLVALGSSGAKCIVTGLQKINDGAGAKDVAQLQRELTDLHAKLNEASARLRDEAEHTPNGTIQ